MIIFVGNYIHKTSNEVSHAVEFNWGRGRSPE